MQMNPKAVGLISFLATATIATAIAVPGLWFLIPLGIFAIYIIYALI